MPIANHNFEMFKYLLFVINLYVFELLAYALKLFY